MNVLKQCILATDLTVYFKWVDIYISQHAATAAASLSLKLFLSEEIIWNFVLCFFLENEAFFWN